MIANTSSGSQAMKQLWLLIKKTSLGPWMKKCRMWYKTQHVSMSLMSQYMFSINYIQHRLKDYLETIECECIEGGKGQCWWFLNLLYIKNRVWLVNLTTLSEPFWPPLVCMSHCCTACVATRTLGSLAVGSEKKPLYITDRINTVEPRSKDTPDYLSNVNIT